MGEEVLVIGTQLEKHAYVSIFKPFKVMTADITPEVYRCRALATPMLECLCRPLWGH